jgi:hypothetical protein
MYTPAALILAVVALSSPRLPWILMGSSSGNRFPVLASDDNVPPRKNTRNPPIWGLNSLVEKNDSGLYHEIVEQDRGFIYLGHSL